MYKGILLNSTGCLTLFHYTRQNKQKMLKIATKYVIILQTIAAHLTTIRRCPPMLKPVLYEQVINKDLSEKIDDSAQLIEKRNIDKAEAPQVLAGY